MTIGICSHCGEEIAIRNPSGYCDHLYYPDNCKTCQKKSGTTIENDHEESLIIENGELRAEVARLTDALLAEQQRYVKLQWECEAQHKIEAERMVKYIQEAVKLLALNEPTSPDSLRPL